MPTVGVSADILRSASSTLSRVTIMVLYSPAGVVECPREVSMAVSRPEMRRDSGSFTALSRPRWTSSTRSGPSTSSATTGAKRFNELSLFGASTPFSCATPKVLEREEIVCRTGIRDPAVGGYDLTEKGRALNRVIESIADWGMEWMPAAHHCADASGH